MARHKRRPLIAALCFGLCAMTWAQFKPTTAIPQNPRQSQPTFTVKVSLVRVLVSVRDHSGALITNLDKQAFHVFDSGVPQEIAVFERNTSLPLSVAVLIDTSGSTQIDLHYETESVLTFIPTLLGAGNPDDTFALLDFNWRTNLDVDFSRNLHQAERALRGLKGEGGTSLYDAIYLVSDLLDRREGRHVVVVVTDGGDTTSYKRYEDALRAAQRADVVMYPIVVVPIANDAGRNIGGEHALATLAASTGGRIFYPQGFDQLDAAFADILRELRTQYLLGFYPHGVREDPRLYHPLKIVAGDGSLRVTVRSGYYTP